jgi:thiol:disulfide interchange protein DsbA
MKTQTLFARFGKALVAGALLAAASVATAAIEPQQGVHYKLLQPAQPTNVAPGKVEVVEVFWYACGHCYLLEPKLEAWDRSGRPANAQLVRLPATWNPLVKTHARVFYTGTLASRTGIKETGVRSTSSNRLDRRSDRGVFTSRGVSKADFRRRLRAWSTPRSCEVKTQTAAKISGTPTVIVTASTSPTSAWPAARTSCSK